MSKTATLKGIEPNGDPPSWGADKIRRYLHPYGEGASNIDAVLFAVGRDPWKEWRSWRLPILRETALAGAYAAKGAGNSERVVAWVEWFQRADQLLKSAAHRARLQALSDYDDQDQCDDEFEGFWR